MLSLKSNLSLDKLVKLASELEDATDEGYVQMAALQSTNYLLQYPEIKEAAAELASLRKLDPVYIMVNTMPAGKELPLHQDWLEPTPLQPYKGPLIERWHLPIVTNDGVLWFDKEHPSGYYLRQGYWSGPVPYWNKHTVVNLGTTSRVHLIIDLDCPEPMGIYE